MMKMPSKEELELDDAINPWLDWDEDREMFLKPDAPEEIKKKYDYWMKKYIIPSRKAAENGAIFY